MWHLLITHWVLVHTFGLTLPLSNGVPLPSLEKWTFMYLRDSGIYVTYFTDSLLYFWTVLTVWYVCFFNILRVYSTQYLSNVVNIYTVKTKQTKKSCFSHKYLKYDSIIEQCPLRQRVLYTCSITVPF